MDITEKTITEASEEQVLKSSPVESGETSEIASDSSGEDQFTEKQREERLTALQLERTGDRFLEGDQYDKAIDFLRRASQIYGRINDRDSYARAYYRIGQSFESMRKFEDAEKAYRESKDTYLKTGHLEKFGAAADKVAKSFYWQDKPDEAIAEYRDAIEKGSLNGELYNNLAFILIGKGEYTEAQKYISTAIERRKAEESAELHVSYNNSGIIKFLLGDYREAASDFEKGLHADMRTPEDDRSVQYQVFACPEYKGAKFTNHRVFYDVNTRACLTANLASALAMDGKLEEAVTTVEKAMDMDRDQAYLLEASSWIYLMQGNESKALERLKRAIPYDPANEDIRNAVQLINPYIYAKAGRNDPCPCGSGKKFKKCHSSPV